MTVTPVNTKKKRRKYTPEFKAEAVKLATQGADSLVEVARNLGVSDKSLYSWVADAKRETEGGLTFQEREELARLRRENKRLRMERDILKNRPGAGGRSLLVQKLLSV